MITDKFRTKKREIREKRERLIDNIKRSSMTLPKSLRLLS